jgi:hypothetical protein
MANVLNEFLSGVSKGFSDAAFASFSRRRSTVREDLAQSFSASEDYSPAPASSNLDMAGAQSASASVSAPRAIAAPKRGRKAAGVVDSGKAKRGRKATAGGDAGLTEV